MDIEVCPEANVMTVMWKDRAWELERVEVFFFAQ
jgi:hypothetical protein